MRIISGKHKGFRFPQRNMPHARPTTDRAKEALFNVIDQYYYFEQISVLDLYAGLGSISFEFCSRGTSDVTSVDLNRRSVNYLRDVAKQLGCDIKVVMQKALPFLRSCERQYDIVFADPPYADVQELDKLITTLADREVLASGGVFILEHVSSYNVKHPACYESRKYGQSTFSFFKFESTP